MLLLSLLPTVGSLKFRQRSKAPSHMAGKPQMFSLPRSCQVLASQDGFKHAAPEPAARNPGSWRCLSVQVGCAAELRLRFGSSRRMSCAR